MKLLLIIFILLVGQLSTSYSQAPYLIKSCKIEFVFSTGFSTGTTTIIFNDSGRTEKQINRITVDTSMALRNGFSKEMFANQIVRNQLTIHREDSVLYVDLDNLKSSASPAFHTSPPVFDKTKNKITEKTFLEKKCEVVDFGSVKFWYWNGILLKQEVSLDNYLYATSIDENYVIKSDEFLVPKNIKTE